MLAPADKKLSAGARHTAAWRARERAGRCLLKVEVDLADTVIGLIDRGLLDPLKADDPAALNAAAAKALQQFCDDGDVSRHADRDSIKVALLLKALRRKTRRGAARRDY